MGLIREDATAPTFIRLMENYDNIYSCFRRIIFLSPQGTFFLNSTIHRRRLVDVCLRLD